jgi:prolyl oligopeptidase
MQSTQPRDRQICPAIRTEPVLGRLLLFLAAYLILIRFDLYLRGNFESLYNKLANYPTRRSAASRGSVEAICSAVDMACIWYCKKVRCLQRAAATVCLLRKYGVPAYMVIGAQQMPFKAHAWVEVDGKVVNDKRYVSEMYGHLARC